MTALLAIPLSTLHKIFTPWTRVININESASILNTSKWSQSYRIEQFISDKEFLSKNVNNYENVGFIKIDPDIFPFDNFKSFDKFIKKQAGPSKKSYVVMVSNADYLLTKFHEVLGYINSYAINNANTSFLFFFEKNITLPEIYRKIDSYPVLLQNIITTLPYDESDIDNFIKYKEKTFGISLPIELINKIKYNCGKRLGLITQCIRHYSLTRDEKNIFDHDEINLKVRLIWDELEASEKKLLKKIVKKEYDFTPEEKDIIDHLLKIHWLVRSKKNLFKLTINLLAHLIEKNIAKKATIAVNGEKKITINDVVVDEFFSRRERKLIRSLLKDKNKRVSRDYVGNTLWEEGNYTDWALDQAIRRLRNKFFKLGISKDIIKTQKNSGFIFQA